MLCSTHTHSVTFCFSFYFQFQSILSFSLTLWIFELKFFWNCFAGMLDNGKSIFLKPFPFFNNNNNEISRTNSSDFDQVFFLISHRFNGPFSFWRFENFSFFLLRCWKKALNIDKCIATFNHSFIHSCNFFLGSLIFWYDMVFVMVESCHSWNWSIFKYIYLSIYLSRCR